MCGRLLFACLFAFFVVVLCLFSCCGGGGGRLLFACLCCCCGFCSVLPSHMGSHTPFLEDLFGGSVYQISEDGCCYARSLS